MLQSSLENAFILEKIGLIGPKSLLFLVSARVAQTRSSAFLGFCLFDCLTMNCSQNCWIDWNYAALCFKQLFFYIGVWTFARLPILCVWDIWCVSNNRAVIYHVFIDYQQPPPPKKNKTTTTTNKQTNKTRFWSRPETGDFYLFFVGGGGGLISKLQTIVNLQACYSWLFCTPRLRARPTVVYCLYLSCSWYNFEV